MEWLNQNAGAVQAVTGGLTVVVWVTYLHVFVVGFYRRRRPEILISVGAGQVSDARLLVANLGLEPIYIADIILRDRDEGSERRADVTDSGPADATSPTSRASRQGPLASGEMRDFGSFAALLDEAGSGGRSGCLEVLILAAAASTARLVGASREFVLTAGDGGPRLRPTTPETRQLRSFRQRRRLTQELEQSLADRADPGDRAAC